MWLIVWLVSLPLAAVIQFVMRFALQDTETNATDGIKMVVNMVSLLMGMYGLLGWIPLVVSLARNKR
jgi:hypothetical protein